MKFPEDTPVTIAKRTQLKERISALGINLVLVDERAIKGSGPGGQKVNKTSNGVLLRYDFNGEIVVVKCARERSHALNRFFALRELVDRIQLIVAPESSGRVTDALKIRKQKDRRRRRQ